MYKIPVLLIKGALLVLTVCAQAQAAPFVTRMDVDSLSLGMCSHVSEPLGVTITFDQTMKESVLPTIELEYAKGQWTTLQLSLGAVSWEEAHVGLPSSRLKVSITLPEVSDQTNLRPRFRVSGAKSAASAEVMRPYVKEDALRYLILKDDEKSWFILPRRDYLPNERLEGRFNIAAQAGGTFFLALYAAGAPNDDWLGFSYASRCSTVTWSVDQMPGPYELRTLRALEGDDEKRYELMQSIGFDVVTFPTECVNELSEPSD